MKYTRTVKITLPAGLADIAASIGRALDPDTGGDNSFGKDIASYDSEGLPVYANTISTSTPCTEEFYQQALYLLNHPEALYAVVSADYEARWAGMTPPTLDECVLFCTSFIPELVLETLIQNP